MGDCAWCEIMPGDPDHRRVHLCPHGEWHGTCRRCRAVSLSARLGSDTEPEPRPLDPIVDFVVLDAEADA